MSLYFNKIHKGNIFNSDFDNLTKENGTIEFKKKSNKGGACISYAWQKI